MTELDATVLDGDDAVLLRLLECGDADVESRERRRDHAQLSRAARSGDEQRRLRRPRELRDATTERSLDCPANRKRIVQRLDARELRGTQQRRNLDERKRIAGGRLVQQRGDAGIDRPGRVLHEQRSRRVDREPFEVHNR